MFTCVRSVERVLNMLHRASYKFGDTEKKTNLRLRIYKHVMLKYNIFRFSSVSSMETDHFPALFGQGVNCLAALKVASYQITQVQTEDDITD